MIDFLRDINQFSCSSFAKENERLVNLSKKENCIAYWFSEKKNLSFDSQITIRLERQLQMTIV